VFHNCKRGTLGLRETRSKVWLLDIEYRKRETFAYSCESYARILELGTSPAARQALADEYSRAVSISDERVDGGEVARIVSAAAAARNGWKVILAQCAPAHWPRLLRRTDHNEKTA
jgi:hypothetical protein